MAVLAWLYTVDSPILCTFPDLSPLSTVFDATHRFNHANHSANPDYNSFFGASMYLFSSLMANRDNSSVHDGFVQNGYVPLIATRMPVACPGLQAALEADMVKFPFNADVLLATCSVLRLVFFPSSQVRRPTPSLRLVNLVLGAMRDHLHEYLLQVECLLTLDVLLDSRQVLNFLSQHNAARTLCGIIGIKSTLVAKLEMGLLFLHTLQSEFVQASFSLLSKLPLCVTSTDFSATTVSLASVVAQVMRQHKTDSTIQSAALHTLDKYMLPYSHLHCRFRLDTSLLLVRSAIELPDMSPASRAVAENILRVCSV